MRTIFLAGGIGSGKSTVAGELERLGCERIDLDQLSREVLEPGLPTTHAVAEAFGLDLLDPVTGALDRRELARRAFATTEQARLLEALELPAIRALLEQRLGELTSRDDAPETCLVEIPLLDRMEESLGLADEVVVVTCPLDVRRVRAVQRGMTEEDFEARRANQPDDGWLRDHATVVIDNGGSYEDLIARVDEWYQTFEQGEVSAHGGETAVL